MTEQAPVAPVAPEPKTPAEASARIKELTGTKEWSDLYLKGSGPHRAELDKLQALANSEARDARIDLAMAGKLEEGRIFQDKEHVDNVRSAQFLRDSGVDDPAVIRQVLSGEPVSQAEWNEAKSQRDRLMKDHDFQKRYLSGDGEAVRAMTLLNVIITRDVKKGAAA